VFQIELQNCGKSFNQKWLYKNVSMELKLGEKWAILGPNGSGKSTFTLMLAGQIWPTEGTILRKSNSAVIPENKVHETVALASPALELPEEFTLTEIIQFQKGLKPFSMENPLKTLAEVCGFDKATLNKPLATFSSGMKQRVKLCLAAFAKTPLLILDEPLSNLDEAGAEVYQQLLSEYSANRLVVIASNRPEEYTACTQKLRIGLDGLVSLN
jgi:ABC-type multidrug transport system ATPase subunit